ncbi:MAG TPA: hypothetical protein VGK06_10940 [Methanosarcina sp.]|jgi:hypothetical protein
MPKKRKLFYPYKRPRKRKMLYPYETVNDITGQKLLKIKEVEYINGDWASGIGELGGMGGY